jgi:hypothetical protein
MAEIERGNASRDPSEGDHGWASFLESHPELGAASPPPLTLVEALAEAIREEREMANPWGAVPTYYVANVITGGRRASRGEVSRAAAGLRKLEKEGQVVAYRPRAWRRVFWCLPGLTDDVASHIRDRGLPDLICSVEDVLAALQAPMPLTFGEISRRLGVTESTASSSAVLSARLSVLRKRGLVERTFGGPEGTTRFYGVTCQVTSPSLSDESGDDVG